MSRSAQNSKDLFTPRSPRYPPPPPHLEAVAAASFLILRRATTSICNLLRRLCFKTASLFEFSMDSGNLSLGLSTLPLDFDDDYSIYFTSPSTTVAEPLCLVPLSWWNDAASAMNAGHGEEIDGIAYNVTSSLNSNRNFGADDWLCHTWRETEIVLEISRGNVTETGTSRGEALFRVRDGHFALLSEWMFVKAFKWHTDMKDTGGYSMPANLKLDLFCLQVSLSYKTNSLVIKINQKDNTFRNFERASAIFSVDSGMMQISDFSGKINQIFIDGQKSDKEAEQPELFQELQLFGLVEAREFKREKMMTDQFKAVAPSFNGSVKMTGSVGLAGLPNLGNTCFMNSAVQCLVHTSDLVDYFLGDFQKDLNSSNPLGMNGELALTFGELLRKLWAPGRRLVYPSALKSMISRFNDNNQHDAQEFLSCLLDTLHEDLNRVKSKPYIEVSEGFPDEELADELWRIHQLCNDSVIGDLFYGQLRSTLVCAVCRKLSIKYETFTSLSLELPVPLTSTLMRGMTLTVFSTDGVMLPETVTIYVPKHGQQKDLIDAISKTCCLKEGETLLVALVYEYRIVGFLNELSASVDLIKNEDVIIAYRLPKESDGSSLVVFTHEREDKSLGPKLFPGWKFGIPLVSRISNLSEGSQIRQEFLKILQPFLSPVGKFSNLNHTYGDISMMLLEDGDPSAKCESSARINDVQFYLGGGFVSDNFCIKMDGPVPSSSNLQVLVSWPERMVEDYVSFRSKSLPQVCERERISLYKCLDAFLEEEPLGLDNTWLCLSCNAHRRASKKLDLWRLPEILVINLKRFTSSNDKLKTLIEFPTVEFDLSNYMAHNPSKTSYRYSLYAVSNHIGETRSGHYTSYVRDRSNRWFEFNDDMVREVEESIVVSPSAYVLFFRRNSNAEPAMC